MVTAEVEIGTPPRIYNMSVETGVSYVFAFDKEWKYIKKHIPYDPSESSTAIDEEKHFNHLLGPTGVYGSLYSDVVTVPNAQASLGSQVLGAITELYHYESAYSFPVDGMLGMGWDPDSKDVKGKWASPILKAFDKGQRRIFFVYLAPYGSDEESFIEFGAKTMPPKECYVPIVAVAPVFTSKHHTSLSPRPFFHLHSFRTADYVSTDYWVASVDTGTAVIHMSEHVYYEVLDIVRADFDWTWHLFTVPCEHKHKLSPWTLGIGETELSIPPSQYVIDIGIGDGKCAVAIGHDKGEDNDWILGNPFVRTYCVGFNIDEDELLFALAKQ